MYKDSSINRSKWFLALCNILKCELSKSCLASRAWERMDEVKGEEMGRPVRADKPLCSAIRRNKFLCV